jgi:uncharacterized protein (DUF4213/DUF364 family)
MGFWALQKWLFYDALLDLVPKEAKVENCVIGRHWVMVESDLGEAGLAHFLGGESAAQLPDPASFIGQNLWEVAKLVKSWDNFAAAIGLSAINSAANSRLSHLIDDKASLDPRKDCAFDFFLDKTRGRKVTVVGHFPHLDKIAKVATLTILERNPQAGDLPDPAAEYVLDDQDAVFLTGTTIINKTLPRLLELTQGKEVFLVGPSVPMFSELFKFGVTSLSGTLVADRKKMAEAIAAGLSEEIFQNGGLMVNIYREDLANAKI